MTHSLSTVKDGGAPLSLWSSNEGIRNSDASQTHPLKPGRPPKILEQKPQGLEKDSYLKLLMAELKNQNPLEPFDHQQMASQLAQFHSIEELGSIREAVETLHRALQEPAAPLLQRDVLYLREANHLHWGRTGKAEIILQVTRTDQPYSIKIFDEEGHLLETQEQTFTDSGFYTLSYEKKPGGVQPHRIEVNCEADSAKTYEWLAPVGLKRGEAGDSYLINEKGQLVSCQDWPILIKTEELKTLKGE